MCLKDFKLRKKFFLRKKLDEYLIQALYSQKNSISHLFAAE